MQQRCTCERMIFMNKSGNADFRLYNSIGAFLIYRKLLVSYKLKNAPQRITNDFIHIFAGEGKRGLT